MNTICLATNNQGKIKELRQLLSNTAFEIVSLKELSCFDDLPETGNTFKANSLQKAQYIFDNYKVPCIADDSGLEIDALNNEPGVYSARYAGTHGDDEANTIKVLENLSGIPLRTSRFRTVVTFINSRGEAYFFEGKVEGTITLEKRGTGGFGYDPIFIPNGFDKTFAELPAEIKNKISHRAMAMQALVQKLSNIY